jgi:hypothetical protein
MKKTKYLLLLVLTCALTVTSYPHCYGAFEDFSGGARMAAMSDVFCAIADDSEAVFAQPAGLSLIGAKHFSVSYGRLFAGLSDQSVIGNSILAFSMPVKEENAVAIGYKNTGLDGYYAEQSVIIGAARNLFQQLSAGVNFKYLTLRYGQDDYTKLDPVFASGYDKSGFDLDLGLLYRPFEKLSFGYSRQNLLGADLGLSQAYQVGGLDHLGGAYREKDLTLAAETIFSSDKNIFAFGAEKSFFDRALSLRFGCSILNSGFNKITGGVGFVYKNFGIDYAIDFPVNGIENTSGTHYLTFSGFIGLPEKPVKAAPAVDAAPEPQRVTPPPQQEPTAKIEPAPAPVITEQKPAEPEKVSPPEPKKAPAAPPVPILAPRVSETINSRPGITTYKVKAHETLPELAEKFYGDRAKWLKIYEANKEKIEKGSLKEGQILLIP